MLRETPQNAREAPDILREAPATVSGTIRAAPDPAPEPALLPIETRAAMLARNFAAASSRVTPRRATGTGYVIHLGLIGLWTGLLALGLVLDGPFAWSTGLVYLTYDTALLVITGMLTINLWKPRAAPAIAASATRDASARPGLAVIVAAHNEAGILAASLRALAGQSDPPECILLADDGSSDDTAAVLLREFGLRQPEPGAISGPAPGLPALRWLRLPHGGKARALNAALALMNEEVILTVDADTALAPNSLGEIRAAFTADPQLAAATGVLIPVCGKGVVSTLFQHLQTYEYIRNYVSRYAYMQIGSLLLVSGAFAAFRRAPLLAVGGFDPECLVEDYELIHRMHRYSVDHGQDWRIAAIGSAHAHTDVPDRPLKFLRQRRRWFAGFLETQYWHRDMIGNPRFGMLGRLILPIKAFDTMQPIFGLTAFLLLGYFLLVGQLKAVAFVLIAMLVKILIDLAFHAYSILLYRRWTGMRMAIAPSLASSFIEPFTFQLLRHSGAAWGWLAFIRGRRNW